LSQEGRGLEAFGRRLERWVRSWMPDPFIFAIILTIVGAVLVVLILHPYRYVGWSGTVEFVIYKAWYGGFWKLLTFSMQMVLILVTGYVIAYHPIVYRGLARLAAWPRDTKTAAVLAALVSILLSWVSWGLSLIGGAVIAREIGKQAVARKRPIHYPAVVAAAYAGLGLTWHWGLTSSAALLMNTPNNFLSKTLQELYGRSTVPLSETIFHPYTIANFILVTVAALAIFWAISPRGGEVKTILDYDPNALEERVGEQETREARTVAEKLENSRLLALITVAMGFIALYYEIRGKGLSRALNLNVMNFIFIMVGMLLYANPIRYARAFYNSVRGAAGVILQFPFYAGIFGLFNTKFSPLGINAAQVIADKLASIATPATWPIMAWLIAGLINLFIPSGGGEWAAIGEILVRAGHALGVPVGKTIIAYAVGDAWTNLLQPFWAIPLLHITSTKARDVFGYTIALMLLIAPIIALGLTLIPY